MKERVEQVERVETGDKLINLKVSMPEVGQSQGPTLALELL